MGVYVSLPWLAPLFMAWGWISAGELVYLVYATRCHQMPEASGIEVTRWIRANHRSTGVLILTAYPDPD
jgi:hypothetical protein